MSVSKDPRNGKWMVTYFVNTLNGERKRKRKTGFDTKREAKQYEIEKLESENVKVATLDMIFKVYMESIQHENKETTLRMKDCMYRHHIKPFFGDRVVSELSIMDIKKWQNTLVKSYSIRTVKLVHAILNNMLKFAVEYLGLSKNVCSIVGFKVSKQHVDEGALKEQYWTYENYKSFVDRMSERKLVNRKLEAYVAIVLLYWTGMRVGEALALTMDDIDMESKTISINKTKTKYHSIQTPKTKSSVRTISVHQNIINLLVDLTDKRYKYKKNQPIFLISDNNLRFHFYKWQRETKVPLIKIHDLRHSHASFLISQNMPLLLISERLGHANSTITLSTYAHLFPSDREKITSLLDEFF